MPCWLTSDSFPAVSALISWKEALVAVLRVHRDHRALHLSAVGVAKTLSVLNAVL
jgi:hypothetical protein